MKLKQILNEIDKKTGIAEISKFFHECINKYFPEYKKFVGTDWDIPKFTIKSLQRNAGQFNYIPVRGKIGNPILIINTDFASSEFSRPITFHETIHYIQANLTARKLTPYESGKWKDAHDSYFIEKMNLINSKEGVNYVTKTENAEKLQVSANDFWVYGFITLKNEYAYMWSIKENDVMKNWINNVAQQKYPKTFIFKTNDYYFKTPQNRFSGTKLKFGVVDKPEKEQLINDKL